MRSVISILLTDEDSNLLELIGDFPHFINLRIHLNLTIALTTFLAFVSQIIHYYNFKNNIKPSSLKPFEMISGLISPKSIGLTNEEEVYKIMKVSKISFFICELYSSLAMPLLGFLICSGLYAQNVSLLKFIILGIPNSFLLSIFSIYFYRFTLWQFIYFYIICYYLKSKLKVINERLRQKNRLLNLYKIIKQLNSIYSEIDEYNNNYWSKFLFWVWMLFGLMINTLLFTAIFGVMPLFIRLLFTFAAIFFVFILTFIISTASSVNLEASRSYELLNSHTLYSNIRFLSINQRIKVNKNFI